MEAAFEAALADLPRPAREPPSRPLNDEEIRLLENLGNSCPDWSEVLLTEGSSLGNVTGCRFSGEVLLGLSESPEEGVPAGLAPLVADSTIEGCRLIGCVRVVGIGLLKGYLVEDGSVLERCGRISCDPGTAFGVGTPLSLGLETGERDVPLFPWLSVELAEALSGGETRTRLLPEYRRRLDELLRQRLTWFGGRIGRHCSITDTSVVENSFLLGNVEIGNATAVRRSFLMGDRGRPASVRDGSIVRSSALQWGSVVDSGSVVEESLVGEGSTVERQGKLVSSFLGPNSSLGEGEISASLVGPFVSAHHQSLLIAVRWPAGEGNVGYGANVGSNHTSRQPDQELECGQGVFFGLGCSVKYPTSLLRAPFSVIATGVTTLPQALELPFSLLTQPFEARPDLPPAINEIFPGWVVSDNLYSLLRNERKYGRRNRAVRHSHYPRMLRPKVALWVESARQILRECSGRDVYSKVPGAGKNFFTEASRKRGIEAYTIYLRWFSLEKVFGRVESLAGEGARVDEAMDRVLEDGAETSVRLLRGEYPEHDPEALLEEYCKLCGELKRRLGESRRKDGERGVRIISDYSLVHPSEDALLEDLCDELDASYRKAADLFT